MQTSIAEGLLLLVATDRMFCGEFGTCVLEEYDMAAAPKGRVNVEVRLLAFGMAAGIVGFKCSPLLSLDRESCRMLHVDIARRPLGLTLNKPWS